MLDGISRCFSQQFSARRVVRFRSARFFEKVQPASIELQPRRRVKDRSANCSPRARRRKPVGALPGFEGVEPISAHLLGEGKIGDSLPILRLLSERLENPQSLLGIAPVEFNMTDSSLDFRAAIGSEFREPPQGFDRGGGIPGIRQLHGQRLLQSR